MIIPLEKCCDKEVNLIGNKAKNLCWLISKKFSCPKGFVIPSSIFSEVIEDSITKRLMEIEQSEDDIEEYFEILERSMENFTNGGSIDFYDFLMGVKEDIEQKLKEKSTIFSDITEKLTEKNFVYVYARSSTNYSDSKSYSFAGAFESIPFQFKKNNNLIRAVIGIVLSIFRAEAFYCAMVENKIPLKEYLNNIRIAVILHKMEKQTPYMSGEIRLSSQGEVYIRITRGLGKGIMIPKWYPNDGPPESSYWETSLNTRESRITSRPDFRPMDCVWYKFNDLQGFGTVHDKFTDKIRSDVTEKEMREVVEKIKQICGRLEIKNYLKELKLQELLIEFTVYSKEESIYLLQIRPEPEKQNGKNE